MPICASTACVRSRKVVLWTPRDPGEFNRASTLSPRPARIAGRAYLRPGQPAPGLRLVELDGDLFAADRRRRKPRMRYRLKRNRQGRIAPSAPDHHSKMLVTSIDYNHHNTFMPGLAEEHRNGPPTLPTL